MSDAKLTVDAGACRFITTIGASSEDGMTVLLNIETDCPNVKKLAENMKEADAMDAVYSKISENRVLMRCYEFIPHPACPIPCALVKACEVACDLALKREVSFKFV